MPSTSPSNTPQKSVDCHFTVENDPYRIDTVVYIGDAPSLLKWMKKEFGEKVLDGVDADFEGADGMTIPCKRVDGSQFVLLWLRRFNFMKDDFANLVHETTHTSVYVLRLSGVHSAILDSGVSDSDDECLAYVMGQMLERIMAELGRKYLQKSRSSR